MADQLENLESLFENPKIFSKILRELRITYAGIIKVDSNQNQIKAFVKAAKLIYNIGSNTSNHPIIFRSEFERISLSSLNFNESERACTEKLVQILSNISNQPQIKKTYAIPDDWRSSDNAKNDFFTLELLSHIFKIPIKVLIQVQKEGQIFEQDIINPEFLSSRPCIDLIAQNKENFYNVFVLVSRESLFHKEAQYTIEIERDELNINESEKLAHEKLIKYYKRIFEVNDKVLTIIEGCITSRVPVVFKKKENDELIKEIIALRSDHTDINRNIRTENRKVKESFVFSLADNDESTETGCRRCLQNTGEPFRLTCGCWYHLECLHTYFVDLFNRIHIGTEDYHFKCENGCQSEIPLKVILSLTYFQKLGVDVTFYRIFNKFKCQNCNQFYSENDLFDQNNCKHCIKLVHGLCRFCDRKYVPDNMTNISNFQAICKCCVIEFLYYNRFSSNIQNIQNLQNLIAQQKCGICGNEAICYIGSEPYQCYDCSIQLIRN